MSKSTINGTSYYGQRILTSYADLVYVFGEPEKSNERDNKNTWVCYLENGNCFTIYDWYVKGNPEHEPTEKYFFNIGAHSLVDSIEALELITDRLKQVV